jgi:hypothetical protein
VKQAEQAATSLKALPTIQLSHVKVQVGVLPQDLLVHLLAHIVSPQRACRGMPACCQSYYPIYCDGRPEMSASVAPQGNVWLPPMCIGALDNAK